MVGGGILAALIASPAIMPSSPLGRPAASRPFASEPRAALVEPSRIPALLARRATAVQTSRNPFVFATRPQPTPPAPAPEPAPAPLPPPPPAVTLSAIAEQSGANGAIVRTAVLSIDGQVFLAKEGEQATPRFTVLRITAEVVELRDALSEMPVRLALR